MERKTLSAYRAVFRLIKRVCPAFNPEKIVTDWEYNQQRAWQEAFPRMCFCTNEFRDLKNLPTISCTN